MKKIVFLIAVIFTMIPFFVKANTVNLVSDRYDNIYVYYYDAELGRTRFLVQMLKSEQRGRRRE